MTVLRRAQADEAIRLRGMMSHLVYGDDPDQPVNDLQAQRFRHGGARARSGAVRGRAPVQFTAAMTRPDLAFDMVRAGIAVYGLSRFRNAATWDYIRHDAEMPVALVRSVRSGDGVSYGHTWIADRDTTLALLPIGYADGVYRTLSGRIDV